MAAPSFLPGLDSFHSFTDSVGHWGRLVLLLLFLASALFLVERFILSRWKASVVRSDAEWDDLLYQPVRLRTHIFLILIVCEQGIEWIMPGDGRIPMLQMIARTGFILLSGSVASMGVKFVLPAMLEKMKGRANVNVSGSGPLAVILLRFLIWALTIYVAFLNLQIELFGLFASLAVFSIIIGLAVQQTLGNMFNSFMTALDRPFEIGDRIEVEGTVGNVVSIGILSTKILTFNEELVIIPNNNLVNSTIINYARGGGDGSSKRVSVQIEIGVGYKDDPAHVKQVLLRIAKECEHALENPSPSVMFVEFGEYSKNFRLYVWINDYRDIMITKDWIHEQIDKQFTAEGIDIPYPTAIEIGRDDAPDESKLEQMLQEHRKRRSLAQYEVEQEKQAAERSQAQDEISGLKAKLKDVDLSGSEAGKLRERIRELENTLSLEVDLDD